MPRSNTEPQLHHKVVLYTEALTPNALGEQISGFSAGSNVWADVRPLSSSESYRAQRLSQSTTHRVMIRWRTGVDINDRMTWRGRWLRVETATDPDGLREWLEIMATDEGEAIP